MGVSHKFKGAPAGHCVNKFWSSFSHKQGGFIHTDQEWEQACSSKFSDMVLCLHKYVMEPTSADSPSQNGVVEIYNDKLAVHARTLLYGSSLPAKYWSLALIHLLYLHNCLV
jgi:hypothetical protein